MWKCLFYIRESEVYLSTGELLYNVIAVYIITVLIKTSVKFESYYNLLAVSCYLELTIIKIYNIFSVDLSTKSLLVNLLKFQFPM